MKIKKVQFYHFITLSLYHVFIFSPCHAQDLSRKLLNAWNNVHSYQCTYKASTLHDGKITETIMRYTFQKPNKIRMDIEKPQKGAVLIYNPEISEKVRVRPFPSLPFFVLHYNLTDKTVSSDSGGTIDRSDLGHRLEVLGKELEQDGVKFSFSEQDGWMMDVLQKDTSSYRRYVIGKQNLLTKVELLDSASKVLETFEWIDIQVNPSLDLQIFRKF